MKLKKIRPPGGARVPCAPPLDPPLLCSVKTATFFSGGSKGGGAPTLAQPPSDQIFLDLMQF